MSLYINTVVLLVGSSIILSFVLNDSIHLIKNTAIQFPVLSIVLSFISLSFFFIGLQGINVHLIRIVDSFILNKKIKIENKDILSLLVETKVSAEQAAGSIRFKLRTKLKDYILLSGVNEKEREALLESFETFFEMKTSNKPVIYLVT